MFLRNYTFFNNSEYFSLVSLGCNKYLKIKNLILLLHSFLQRVKIKKGNKNIYKHFCISVA